MKDTVLSLLHKNGVITGLVESYCLPCEVLLGTQEVARAHIADLAHCEKLDSTHYLDTHKDDGIRKMPQGYYCEYCNKLFCTTINVNLHVAEGEHQRNKDSQWLREQGDVVIVRNQLVVDSDSWHGLVGGACALCNTEYLDKDAHKTIATHLLKLIQSNVELHASGAIYRKGNDFFHCLICNAIFPFKSFGTHFEQTDHVQFYNECCETFKNITAHVNINGKLASKVNIQIERDDENTADIGEISDLKSIENKQTFEIETNMTIKTQEPSFLLQTTTGEETSYDNNGESMLKKDCLKDEEFSGLQLTNNGHVSETEISDNEDTFENSAIKSNVNNFPATTEQNFETKQSTEDLIQKVQRMPISKKEKAKIIANENKIRYKEGYTRAYCSICLTNISSALKNIERHVTSVTHKYEARRIFKFVSDVMPLHEFVEELKLIELELTTYAVINNIYCIDLTSYLLMTRYHSYIHCNICEINFNVGLFDDHQLSETHNGALANIPVLLSHPSEFVREVQPGFYHCGFCNSYEGSWRGLRDHCKSLTHFQQKSICSKKLKIILSSNRQT